MKEDIEEVPLDRVSNEGKSERRGWGERGTGLGSCRDEETRGERWIGLAGVDEMGEGRGEG